MVFKCTQVTAVGHAAMLAAIQRYAPGMVGNMECITSLPMNYFKRDMFIFINMSISKLTDTICICTRKA